MVEGARRATHGDLASMARLRASALAALTGQRGGRALAAALTAAVPETHLADLLDDDRWLVVLGAIEGSDVGLGVTRTGGPAGSATVELLYVEPPARQVGVAEAMLDLTLAWCRMQGCAGVDAPALPGNRAAKSFFEDHGFVARLLVMHRPLPDGEAEGAATDRS